MNNDRGLICAYLLDGKGGGTALDWAANLVAVCEPSQRPLWAILQSPVM